MFVKQCKCGFIFAMREYPTVCPRCYQKREILEERLEEELDAPEEVFSAGMSEVR